MYGRKLSFTLTALFVTAIAPSAAALARDVPFVPTPEPVVREMLELADVGPDDLVYDLGSGDGRIVITAAKEYGARAVGVDIDPRRVAEGRANARRAGVEDRVRFIQGDLFDVDLRPATAVTLYLLPKVNLELRPKLLAELRPGTPVVSHAFNMGGWKPEAVRTVKNTTVYLWRVPARASGTWEYRIPTPDGGTEAHRLEIAQRFDEIYGSLTIDGKRLDVVDGSVSGSVIQFGVARPLNGRTVMQRFKGKIIDRQIAGMALVHQRVLARGGARPRDMN